MIKSVTTKYFEVQAVIIQLNSCDFAKCCGNFAVRVLNENDMLSAK